MANKLPILIGYKQVNKSYIKPFPNNEDAMSIQLSDTASIGTGLKQWSFKFLNIHHSLCVIEVQLTF